MKTILLLGGFGFLGTNILSYIDNNLKDQYHVIVFDKFARHPAGLLFSCVTNSVSGDFTDEECIRSIFSTYHIDLVVHSLSTTIPINAFNARYDIESNLVPTISLLNIMVENGVKDIVYISSGGAVYGNSIAKKHSEQDVVFPISSYGVVKLAIEKYLIQYELLYGLNPLILRLSNPFGPYHYSMRQGVCNVAIEHALNNKTFTVWGDGSAKKDYIFVEDFVRILFQLLTQERTSRIINIASGQLLSLNEILHVIQSIEPSFCWQYGEASLLDVSRFELDTSLLLSLIGEFPFTSFKNGIYQTWGWAKSRKANEKA